ncbi:alpha/beta hydrolase [Effusibacillus pohliae]|uniref:alpha/beta hydrolase n=1 Tax=Effusibacillus pohliae TaxID=232270 RepID=UPI00037F68BD|nr:alpha/beta fold hydrolase [Effusibacillus pohliae]
MEQVVTIRSGTIDLAATIHYPPAEDRVVNAPADALLQAAERAERGQTRIGVDRLFVQTARYLAERGSIVVRFDYGGCGESTGDYGQQGLEDLIRQTRHVIDYVWELAVIDRERLVLLGHSLGGAVALLTGALDPRVKSLVMWAAVAKPFIDIIRIVGEEAVEQPLQSGYVDYSGYRLTSRFFESLAIHQPLLQTCHFAGNVLLVHGSDDEVIPVDYCFLYQRAFWLRRKGRCDKEVILGANHTFSSISHRIRLLQATASWLAADHKNIEWSGWVI